VTTGIQIHVLDAIPVLTVDEESSLRTGIVEGVGDVGLRVMSKGNETIFIGVPCGGMGRHRSYKVKLVGERRK